MNEATWSRDEQHARASRTFDAAADEDVAPGHLLRKITVDREHELEPNISTGCDSALVACV